MVWRQFDINQCRAHNLIKQPLQSWIKMYIDRVTILSLCLINSKYLDHRVHRMSVFLPSEQKFFTWSICFYFCFFSWFLTYISTICVLGKTIRLSILRPRQNVKCLVMLWFLTALQPVSKYCRLVLIFHGESKHNNTALWRHRGGSHGPLSPLRSAVKSWLWRREKGRCVKRPVGVSPDASTDCNRGAWAVWAADNRFLGAQTHSTVVVVALIQRRHSWGWLQRQHS